MLILKEHLSYTYIMTVKLKQSDLSDKSREKAHSKQSAFFQAT